MSFFNRDEVALTMGEQPIYSTKAHVFQIDPNTKKKWLPSSGQAVNVSFYYDSSRNTYRIISVEGSKAVINSTLTAHMTFTKTSQKFGQWSDTRANTVYGLGFTTEAELLKFVDKFNEVKELLRETSKSPLPPPPPTPPNSYGGAVVGDTTPDVTNKSSASILPHLSSTNGNSSPFSDHAALERVSSSPVVGSPGLPSSPILPSSPLVEQLKYENDRLKIALAQSSANAKKWEVELQTLRNNSARLTTALQESTTNVEEWKRRLEAYKDESVRMKKRMADLEKNNTGGSTELLQRQIATLNEKYQDVERESESRQEEITKLRSRIAELQSTDTENHQLHSRLKDLEATAETCRHEASEARSALEAVRQTDALDRSQLTAVQRQIGSRVGEMYALSDKLAELLHT